MEIKVEASTKLDYQVPPKELNLLAGRSAGVCYMKEDFKTLRAESEESTLDRSERTKAGRHHSVCGHGYITFQMSGVPKLFAMLLNNEKVYNASERSARYTKMVVSEREEILYQKWLKRMEEIITQKYGNHKYFSPYRINKLAMENARYFTSVMTPCELEYTVSHQQLNYLCGWMMKFGQMESPIYRMLKPTADEFLDYMEAFGYMDEKMLDDGRERFFSLVARRAREEQFGEVYSVNYEGTYATLAQLQRTRPIAYEMMLKNEKKYYVPQILRDNPELINEWLEDMRSLSDLTLQGELIDINERGCYENLILKAKERLCMAAQIETMQKTNEVINKIILNTKNPYVREDLLRISNKARCASGYPCEKPCGFAPAIDLTRDI